MISRVARLTHGMTVATLGFGLGQPAAQAQNCAIVSNRIAITSGACTVEPGAVLTASNTSAAVSATGASAQIDLRPGATVITPTTRHAIDMIDGGSVLLGPNTLIEVNASSIGVLGISIVNSVLPISLGTGIRIRLHDLTVGTNVSGYGLRAVQNSSVSLGLDLRSDFSRSAYGVRADTGSTVTLTDASSILLTGADVPPGGSALIAVGPGSVITARDGASISNTGRDVTGAYMSNGGLVLMDSSTTLDLHNLALVNGGSAGVVADNTVVPQGTIDGVLLEFSGIAGTGVTATRGAQITVRDASIRGAGIGVVADTLSSVGIVDASISITDANGGIVRTIEPSGATYGTTFVRQSAGLLALGGALDADGVSVSVSANSAYGVHAATSIYTPATAGTLTFTDGMVSTSGLGAHGAVATGSAFVTGAPALQLQSTTVTTTGGGAHGLAAFTGGMLNVSSSAIRAEGVGSYGLFSATASATRQNGASMSGGSLVSTQSTAIRVAGSQLDLSLSDGVQVVGGGGMLSQVTPDGGRAGTLNLTANSAGLRGAASTDAGSNSNMSLANNSLWNMTGSSNLTRLVNDVSTIEFSAPNGPPTLASSYKTLVVGSYTGQGGMIGLNTFLGADGSPSDRVVIDGGSATGQTGLRITNAGGPGALTLGDGIQVVDAIHGGSTSPGAFALSQRVVEGPYEYRLVRSSLDASNAEAWYLRSVRTIAPQPEVAPPPTQPPPPPPPDPQPPNPPPDPEVDPTPPTPPQPEEAPPPPAAPLYRPEVSAYLANQRLAASMFVRSLIDRLGEPQWIETQGFDPPGDRRRSGWLRVEARENSSTSRDGGFDADTHSTLIQGGGEIARWSVGGEQARLHLGGMLGYGRARSDATAAGNAARAEGETEGWSVGAYGVWYQNDANKLGWYTDIWGAYSWFQNTVRGDTLPDVHYDSRALTLSGEVGYAKRVWTGGDWIMEPQAQLIYIDYRENEVIEVNGTRVDGADGDGLISRLGLRTYRTWISSDSRQRTQPYLVLNWWHDSIADAVVFNQIALSDLYPADRYEVKAGVNAQFGHGWTAWGNLGYQWGDQDYQDTALRLGAKYTW